MAYWTNKHWGLVIGAALVISTSLIGIGITALAVLAAIGGFFIGKFLDGELDLQQIQARAQARLRGEDSGPAPAMEQTAYSQNGASVQGPVASTTQPPRASTRVR